MENLVILYFIYLAWGCGRVGGKVSILDIARWMRTTKPTIKKALDKMVENGTLGREVSYRNNREYRWEYYLTELGQILRDVPCDLPRILDFRQIYLIPHAT